MIAFPLRRASNVLWQKFQVDKDARAHMKAQHPCIVWFTGFSGAGKSTIMNIAEQRLAQRGIHTYALDGDNVRHGLNRDLGFTDGDRVENVRRVGEVAKLMVDAGLVVLCAFISPFRAERQMVRSLVGPDEFVEVFVDTPLDVCMTRDQKDSTPMRGPTRAARNGIDSSYEPPQMPDLPLVTTRPPPRCCRSVIAELARPVSS